MMTGNHAFSACLPWVTLREPQRDTGPIHAAWKPRVDPVRVREGPPVRENGAHFQWEGKNIDSEEKAGQDSLNKLKKTSSAGPSSSHDCHSQLLHGDPWECEKEVVNPSPSPTLRCLPRRPHRQIQV